jgi:hypothetical protein
MCLYLGGRHLQWFAWRGRQALSPYYFWFKRPWTKEFLAIEDGVRETTLQNGYELKAMTALLCVPAVSHPL